MGIELKLVVVPPGLLVDAVLNDAKIGVRQLLPAFGPVKTERGSSNPA